MAENTSKRVIGCHSSLIRQGEPVHIPQHLITRRPSVVHTEYGEVSKDASKSCSRSHNWRRKSLIRARAYRASDGATTRARQRKERVLRLHLWALRETKCVPAAAAHSVPEKYYRDCALPPPGLPQS